MQANASGALAANLNSDNSLGCLGGPAAAADPALFHSADLALINLDLPGQHGAPEIDHGPEQLVQHRPGRE
ncbi:hypothetical protein [Arthrobacter dokdonensis]|uniref:hypothetical protein n=1 Tax=Arthrobacter dokdonellae TaxID=2211210 RepID=UPI001F39F3D7|nr:hypothetical protein [Arthrobacter dokdonellae]